MATKTNFQTVDEYIGTFPADVQETLEKIRQTIKEAEPAAEEVISYQIPAFKYHGMMIYFSAYKDHYSISFPPPFAVFDVLKEQLIPYEQSKSTIKFPKNQPFPFDLVSEITKLKAKENVAKAESKKKK